MTRRAVLFDIDGTLIDSVDAHARSWQESLAAFGVERSFEEVRAEIGKGGDLLMRSLVPADRLDSIEPDLEADRRTRFRSRFLPHIRPFPGVVELVDRLRGDGVWVGLASSARADELASYLEIAGLVGRVDAAVTSDDAARSKPYPDIIVAAHAAVGAPAPADCRVVGDAPYDVTAALGAGLATLAVLSGGFPAGVLLAAGAHGLARDIADLAAGYERLFDPAPWRSASASAASS